MAKTKKKGKGKEEEEEEEQFHVEVILATRVVENSRGKLVWPRKKEYLVKWAFYPDESNTWEPERNLKMCERLLDSFWTSGVGMDNKDYPVGTVFHANESWIKQEKQYFAKENDKDLEELRKKREKEQQARIRKYRESGSKSPSVEANPAWTKRSTKKKKKKQAKQTDSESEEPDSLSGSKKLKRKRTKSAVDSEEDDAPATIRKPPKKTQKMDGGRRVSVDSTQAIKGTDKSKGVTSLFSDDSGEEDQTSPEMPLRALPSESKAVASSKTTAEPGSSKSPAAPMRMLSSGTIPKPPPLPTRRPSAPGGSKPAGTPTATPTILNQTKPTASSQSNTPNIPPKAAPTTLPPLPRRSNLSILGGAPSSSTTTPSLSSPQISTSNPPAGISAKSKIRDDALQLVKPGAPQKQNAKPNRPSLNLRTGSSMMPTGFKKKLDLPSTKPSAEFRRTPSTPTVPGPITATMNEPVFSADAMVESPIDLNNVMLGPPDDNGETMMVDDPDIMTPFPTTPAAPVWAPPKSTSEIAAENFLMNIMPEQLAGPLTPAVEEQGDILPPGSLMSRKSNVVGRVRPVRPSWTWSGQVFREADPLQPVFNAKLDNVTDPIPGGMRFSVALSDKDRIILPSFHDNNDLDQILRACKKGQQFGALEPAGEADRDPMRTYSQYMIRFRKFIFVPVSLDGHVVAGMLVFPNVVAFCRKLQVPKKIPEDTSNTLLVVALLPWMASTHHLSHSWRREPHELLARDVTIGTQHLYPDQWGKLLATNPTLHLAFRILKPSNKFLQYVSSHPRRYHIWHGKADGTLKRSGLETHLLRAILKHCSAEPVDDPSAARLVFVHTGALARLHDFPRFATLCATKPHIQFHTYGTHATVLPERWGFREIYAAGGVITFTPGAILHEYFDVMDRVRQIHAHPIWMCYVLPTVIGFVARNLSNDPLAQFDAGKSPLRSLLVAIADGEVALLNSPPTDYSPTQERGDLRAEWITRHWARRPEDPRSILGFCIQTFTQKFGQMERPRATSAILDEISKDLSCIRQQPVIMDQYRRYAVLMEDREQREKGFRDGNEWTTVANFDFRDDFFPKQT